MTWAGSSARGLFDLAEPLFGISISHKRPFEDLNLAISVLESGARAQPSSTSTETQPGEVETALLVLSCSLSFLLTDPLAFVSPPGVKGCSGSSVHSVV